VLRLRTAQGPGADRGRIPVCALGEPKTLRLEKLLGPDDFRLRGLEGSAGLVSGEGRPPSGED
jgi:hypothetical protein